METILGIKWSTMMAGFSGSMVSLSYEKKLQVWQMLLFLVSGMAAAMYLTPLTALYFKLPEATENAVAFLIGLTAMNVLPGLIKLSRRFSSHPEQYLRGRKDGDD